MGSPIQTASVPYTGSGDVSAVSQFLYNLKGRGSAQKTLHSRERVDCSLLGDLVGARAHNPTIILGMSFDRALALLVRKTLGN